MIRRPPRSTRVRSSAASDVYKRQPASCRSPHVCETPSLERTATAEDARTIVPRRGASRRRDGRMASHIGPTTSCGQSIATRQFSRHFVLALIASSLPCGDSACYPRRTRPFGHAQWALRPAGVCSPTYRTVPLVMETGRPREGQSISGRRPACCDRGRGRRGLTRSAFLWSAALATKSALGGYGSGQRA